MKVVRIMEVGDDSWLSSIDSGTVNVDKDKGNKKMMFFIVIFFVSSRVSKES